MLMNACCINTRISKVKVTDLHLHVEDKSVTHLTGLTVNLKYNTVQKGTATGKCDCLWMFYIRGAKTTNTKKRIKIIFEEEEDIWKNACITVLCLWGNAVTVDENKHSNDIPDDVLITDWIKLD